MAGEDETLVQTDLESGPIQVAAGHHGQEWAVAEGLGQTVENLVEICLARVLEDEAEVQVGEVAPLSALHEMSDALRGDEAALHHAVLPLHLREDLVIQLLLLRPVAEGLETADVRVTVELEREGLAGAHEDPLELLPQTEDLQQLPLGNAADLANEALDGRWEQRSVLHGDVPVAVEEGGQEVLLERDGRGL